MKFRQSRIVVIVFTAAVFFSLSASNAAAQTYMFGRADFSVGLGPGTTGIGSRRIVGNDRERKTPMELHNAAQAPVAYDPIDNRVQLPAPSPCAPNRNL